LKPGKLFAAAAIFAALASACAGTVKSRYELAENPVNAAAREKTRTAKLYHQLDTIIILDAILDDDGLRNAWADEDASRRRLGDEEKKAALEKLNTEDGGVKMILALYTASEEWNDLAEKNSRWTVFLETSKGPVRPASIEKTKVEKLYLRDNLPFDPIFRKFYIVKFTKEAAGSPPYKLMMSGQLGETSVAWDK